MENACKYETFPDCTFGHFEVVDELAFISGGAFGNIQHNIM
jgi:hypothetical protein